MKRLFLSTAVTTLERIPSLTFKRLDRPCLQNAINASRMPSGILKTTSKICAQGVFLLAATKTSASKLAKTTIRKISLMRYMLTMMLSFQVCALMHHL
jgi:hypothetical protein